MTVLVTGVAGFIGFHVTRALLARGERVVGIDNVNDYYSVALKEARLAQLLGNDAFRFHRVDISDEAAVAEVMKAHQDVGGIVHLAAQAGVRYSLVNPYAYCDANFKGHLVMLEAARHLPALKSFVYASSSSVYGGNKKQPFSVKDPVDTPVSLYAATKRGCELMSHSYAHLFGIPATGLRFFTVYGPWGRPDMAAFIFTRAILEGTPIEIYNHGDMARDFTYVDDIVAGTIAALDRPPAPAPDAPPHRVYNLGNHRPEKLLHFVGILEDLLGRKAERRLLPMQPGDVRESFADIEESRRDLGFEPRTRIEDGLANFVAWYKSYHRIA